MSEIVLVRHGETEWSRSGRHTGRTDLPLTPAGEAAATALAAALGDRRFVTVLTSPLRRAADTCRLAGLAADAEVVPELREWEYGSYEGRTTADIRSQRPGWSIWRDGAPAGETATQVGDRVDPLIDRLRGVDGDVAVFSHGHLLRVLAARWLELPAAQGRCFALDTAAVSALGWERETPVLRRWNQSTAPDPPSG
ncbi:histidine phosphatase family protein [Natronosporangium hydrolyticum]|uniref:Histidine phosphatase family protein n=1 Tax=Natronosporangium hydrolyticum TaxID=2811111 RepID=A0A895YFF9_9ACTN|nr:histidine phosphatase family protein [Natronosporangium hydrolyticum]QSB16604.1 histidine phosphatase family protein [Natronosporangium hydrolyticum]